YEVLSVGGDQTAFGVVRERFQVSPEDAMVIIAKARAKLEAAALQYRSTCLRRHGTNRQRQTLWTLGNAPNEGDAALIHIRTVAVPSWLSAAEAQVGKGEAERGGDTEGEGEGEESLSKSARMTRSTLGRGEAVRRELHAIEAFRPLLLPECAAAQTPSPTSPSSPIHSASTLSGVEGERCLLLPTVKRERGRGEDRDSVCAKQLSWTFCIRSEAQGTTRHWSPILEGLAVAVPYSDGHTWQEAHTHCHTLRDKLECCDKYPSGLDGVNDPEISVGSSFAEGLTIAPRISAGLLSVGSLVLRTQLDSQCVALDSQRVRALVRVATFLQQPNILVEQYLRDTTKSVCIEPSLPALALAALAAPVRGISQTRKVGAAPPVYGDGYNGTDIMGMVAASFEVLRMSIIRRQSKGHGLSVVATRVDTLLNRWEQTTAQPFSQDSFFQTPHSRGMGRHIPGHHSPGMATPRGHVSVSAPPEMRGTSIGGASRHPSEPYQQQYRSNALVSLFMSIEGARSVHSMDLPGLSPPLSDAPHPLVLAAIMANISTVSAAAVSENTTRIITSALLTLAKLAAAEFTNPAALASGPDRLSVDMHMPRTQEDRGRERERERERSRQTLDRDLLSRSLQNMSVSQRGKGRSLSTYANASHTPRLSIDHAHAERERGGDSRDGLTSSVRESVGDIRMLLSKTKDSLLTGGEWDRDRQRREHKRRAEALQSTDHSLSPSVCLAALYLLNEALAFYLPFIACPRSLFDHMLLLCTKQHYSGGLCAFEDPSVIQLLTNKPSKAGSDHALRVAVMSLVNMPFGRIMQSLTPLAAGALRLLVNLCSLLPASALNIKALLGTDAEREREREFDEADDVEVSLDRTGSPLAIMYMLVAARHVIEKSLLTSVALQSHALTLVQQCLSLLLPDPRLSVLAPLAQSVVATAGKSTDMGAVASVLETTPWAVAAVPQASTNRKGETTYTTVLRSMVTGKVLKVLSNAYKATAPMLVVFTTLTAPGKRDRERERERDDVRRVTLAELDYASGSIKVYELTLKTVATGCKLAKATVVCEKANIPGVSSLRRVKLELCIERDRLVLNILGRMGEAGQENRPFTIKVPIRHQNK
ncbi:hypothetical protein KIPB_002973, partial [Kipferlia bialata]